MRGKFLTITTLLSFILFGYGIWGFAAQKMKLNTELEKSRQAEEEGYKIETEEKKWRKSMLISKVAMIAGLGGICLSVAMLNKKSPVINKETNQ